MELSFLKIKNYYY